MSDTGGPITSRLLASYFDLTTEGGPLHAQCVAQMGRLLLDNQPIPAYQWIAPSALRYLIEIDAPDRPKLDDPRELVPELRSPAWQRLCDLLDAWTDLDDAQRLRTARVAFKLGFWQTVARMPGTKPAATDSEERRRLTRLRSSAQLKLKGEDDIVVPAEVYQALIDVANDPTAPTAARISATANLLVHHARSDRSPNSVRHWGMHALAILDETSPDALSPLLLSALWRAVSFMPFFDGNHHEVARMLDEAEHAAHRGVEEPHDGNRLIALENLRVLLVTRGRAAHAAGSLDQATEHYRSLVALDPLDAQVHVMLADFLSTTGRLADARASYLHAAKLGAPYTLQARMRATELAGR